MKAMFCSTFCRFAIVLTSVSVVSASVVLFAQDNTAHGRKYKSPPPSARIEVTILRDSSGKPIGDAHVIFHPIQGDKDTGYLEVKTNEDGKAIIDVLPIGDTVRMQVIASGFQTYGQDYKVDKAEMSMEIRMKRPGAQYSIYKNPPPSSCDDKSSKPSQNAAPPDSSSKPDAPPSASQPQPK
jgi:hypothetical protein